MSTRDAIAAEVRQDMGFCKALVAVGLFPGRRSPTARRLIRDYVREARAHGFRGSVMARITALTTGSPLPTP